MDQVKIGKFISECRKNKNLTQQELAEILNVTDKTISRWENGKTMPDISLFKSLCEILDISINELLSGEKIEKKDYQEKLEENILNTIDYTEQKIKNNKKIFKTIFLSILFTIILFITLFVIDINRMNQNKPVFFSTWGFSYVPPIDLKNEEIEISIKNYLVEKGNLETKHHDFENTFVSMRIFLIEEKENKTLYNVYAWVLEQKYYFENNQIKKDSGSSIPYKFVVELINDEYKVTDSKIPRDGSYYSENMKNIFPKSVRSDMDKVYTDGTIERLQLDIQEQTKLYFNK